jgi:hypothetical protein
MSDPFPLEERVEAAHLKARAPFDRTSAALEETVRALVRVVDESKLIITRCAARLSELDREVLDEAERSGARAAAKVSKPVGRAAREKPEIQWCTCSMFTEAHVHHPRRLPQPDEVPPS